MVVSNIGCVISLACLFLAIIYYLTIWWDYPTEQQCYIPHLLCCRKEMFEKVNYFIHFNLAIALFLAYFLFVLAIQLARENEVWYSKYSKDATKALFNFSILPALLSGWNPCTPCIGNIRFLITGGMHICGSTFAVPLPISLLLDDVWGDHALPHVGGGVQHSLQEMVVFPTTWLGSVAKYYPCM